jgi:hypothetical protein
MRTITTTKPSPPLSTATLGGDAAGAQKLLGSALSRFRDARPTAIAAQGGPPEGSARAKNAAE